MGDRLAAAITSNLTKMSDETNIDPVDDLIRVDWPSLDEFNSLDRTHGRKFDFDYEPIRKTGEGETGTANQGVLPKES